MGERVACCLYHLITDVTLLFEVTLKFVLFTYTVKLILRYSVVKKYSYFLNTSAIETIRCDKRDYFGTHFIPFIFFKRPLSFISVLQCFKTVDSAKHAEKFFVLNSSLMNY